MNSHFRVGDKYAAALSEGLKTGVNFKKFELANNRLSFIGANLILSSLTNQAESIDLAGNNIGKIGCQHLCDIIKLKNPQ